MLLLLVQPDGRGPGRACCSDSPGLARTAHWAVRLVRNSHQALPGPRPGVDSAAGALASHCALPSRGWGGFGAECSMVRLLSLGRGATCERASVREIQFRGRKRRELIIAAGSFRHVGKGHASDQAFCEAAESLMPSRRSGGRSNDHFPSISATNGLFARIWRFCPVGRPFSMGRVLGSCDRGGRAAASGRWGGAGRVGAFSSVVNTF